MKLEVEKQLSNVRNELRGMSSLGITKTATDRQRLLVSIIQDYVRHLTDGIRGTVGDHFFQYFQYFQYLINIYLLWMNNYWCTII